MFITELALGHPMDADSSLAENLIDPINISISCANIFGYLPVIGTIIGIARIIMFTKILEENPDVAIRKRLCICHITRGCIELIACGLLLLIPDLIFTIGRALSLE